MDDLFNVKQLIVVKNVYRSNTPGLGLVNLSLFIRQMFVNEKKNYCLCIETVIYLTFTQLTG